VIWQGIPPKIIQYGVLFGLIRLGWVHKDYLLHATDTTGYETSGGWGERGSGKSNRTLMHGYWIFQDWDAVLESVVYKPADFVHMLKLVPKDKRLPWLGWDDIGVHFPSAIWRTDIEKYQAVDAAWAAIRTKVSVIDVSIPLIDRLAKNIRDSLSFEIFLGKNQTVLVERLVRLPNIYDRLESNFRKVQVEPIHQIDLYEIPTDVFNEYWDTRLELADEALEKLDGILTKNELAESDGTIDNHISFLKASEELDLAPLTLVQMCKQRIIPSRIIKGTRFIPKESFEELKKVYTERRKRKTKG